MSELYHGEYPVDMTPQEAQALNARFEAQTIDTLVKQAVIQAHRITELEARVKVLELELEAAQCLLDSQYKAGIKLGWHLCATDDEAGYQRVTSGTEHIAELKRIRAERAALNPSARSE